METEAPAARAAELAALVDVALALSRDPDKGAEEALEVVLSTVGATGGALLLREPGAASHRVVAARGGLADAASLTLPALPPGPVRAAALDSSLPATVELLVAVRLAAREVGALALGPRRDGTAYGAQETAFLERAAACAAAPLDNAATREELRRVSQRLSLKVFQLHNLFDVSRELTTSFDEESILHLVAATLLGQLTVTRCAIYLDAPAGLRLAHERGVRSAEGPLVETAAWEPVARALATGARSTEELPAGELRERLLSQRMILCVPLASGERVHGLLALGKRVSGAPYGPEELEFATTLARQAHAAMTAVQLQQIRLAKERQDRELQIAREIQRSLFPQRQPHVPGFQLAAESRPCHAVGGDHFDWIPLPGGRVALAVGDVSGKGTPASILMASLHASLRALAGTASPEAVVARLNRFLYESTQTSKFVTLFYGELDPATRRLRYVNAGHVPPYLVSGRGGARLGAGGPVLGVIEEARYEAGEASLGHGDLLAVVSDGVTEALSPQGDEFGDDRVLAALAAAAGRGAEEARDALVQAVAAWTGVRGCTDDLTVLVVKAGGGSPPVDR